MKKIITVLFAFFGVMFFSACTGQQAVDYNNTIIGEQTKIVTKILEYPKVFDGTYTAEQADTLEKDTIAQIDTSLAKLDELGAFKGDDAFVKAGKDLFGFYKEMVQNEYKQMRDILAKGEDMTAEDGEKINQLAEQIGEKEKPFDAAFQKAQETFASKYKLTIEESELQKEIDALSE